ncbi:MAG: hypothetical protein ACRENK_08275 [Gemmatimonadaceae bacterium]
MRQGQDQSYAFRSELKAETAKQVEKLGLVAWQIADRWLEGWRRKTLDLETRGELVTALREQASREAAAFADANVGGANSHLARHETMALYDIYPGPPA